MRGNICTSLPSPKFIDFWNLIYAFFSRINGLYMIGLPPPPSPRPLSPISSSDIPALFHPAFYLSSIGPPANFTKPTFNGIREIYLLFPLFHVFDRTFVYHLLGKPSGSSFGRIIRTFKNRRKTGARNFEGLLGYVGDAKYEDFRAGIRVIRGIKVSSEGGMVPKRDSWHWW